ncbi:hypothetical protein [Amphibacillus jilinensis]|uniref:hypothetical protein n=1 Tax=Amphibacillus jilinensis TaxID=1216008 RepID=UPI00030EC963|nr:hypothetical protein [Amphibacillus jilinensis]
MKKYKKYFILLLTTILLFSFFLPVIVEAGSSVYVDLGNGWKARIDAPHEKKTGKYHGHVFNPKGVQKGVENVDGTKHDGKTFKDVPKKRVENLKKSKEWKKAVEKNKVMQQQRTKLTWKKFLSWCAKNLVIS